MDNNEINKKMFTFFQKVIMETAKGGCQEAESNRKEGFSVPYRLFSTCDNNPLDSHYVWTKEKG